MRPDSSGYSTAEAWRRLGQGGDDARRSIDTSRGLEWYEASARDAEAAGDGFAARWHLDRLIAARPDDGLFHARRAVARLRERGDATGVSADLDRALELGPRDRIVDWLAHRAEDLRLSGLAHGALILLDRAIASRPGEWRLYALCAEALGTLGRRVEHDADQARAVDLGADIPALMRIAEERARARRFRESALLFDRAIGQGTIPYEVWEWAALTHLAADDLEGYRRTCAVMRSRYPTALPEAEVERLLGRVCTLGPGGLGDDGKALGWATGTPGQASAQRQELKSRFLALLGAVQFRSGRYAEAIESIRRGIDEADGQVLPAHAAFLAMALFRSGDRPAARAMLARVPRARDAAGGDVHRQRMTTDQLRHEAECLLFGERLPEDVFAP